tara:strand:+ start:3826 stop:5082 length:1257 start_codon:yes stop_codon:yes gene_type:complete
MKYQAIKGVKDILPKNIGKWHFLEKTAKELFETFCYYEIRVPVFEKTAVFTRSIGEDTDIVEKEMYTFKDKGDESITLRPEGTASIVRAFVEHQMYNPPSVVKLYYSGPMFRFERPQSGRFRQFYQIGVEAFGSEDPSIDAEVIFILIKLLNSVGLSNLELNLNNIGCPDCRPVYRDELQKYFESRIDALCQNCKQRNARNPLRILDCKNKGCIEVVNEAPTIDHFLCDICKTNFDQVQNFLRKLGTPFKINLRLVRGLDYYSRTAFEVLASGLGAQNAVAGGGRYDGLVKEFGGPQTPAVGFAMGVERIISLMEHQEKFTFKPKVFIVSLGDTAKEVAFQLLNNLRMAAVPSDWSNNQGSLKSQMRKADRSAADFVLIIGENELKNEKLILRNMKTSQQEEMPLKNIVECVKSRIKS